MARKKTHPELAQVKSELARRLRTIRVRMYGEAGGAELARAIGVPARSWYNYEIGVTVPGEVLLRFLEATGVEPHWLLHGEGPKYRTPPPDPSPGGRPEPPAPSAEPPVPTSETEALLRGILRRLERGEIRITLEVRRGDGTRGGHPGPPPSDPH